MSTAYTIKAHPTRYKGVLFRSRLEARWAAFADLAGWQWKYEPLDFEGWTPDFWFSFPCGHSECSGSHELYAEVKPYASIAEFEGHAVTKIERYSVPSPAMFGLDPFVTEWEMAHGAGGGIECAQNWVWVRAEGGWRRNASDEEIELLWAEAGNLTRYQPEDSEATDNATLATVLDKVLAVEERLRQMQIHMHAWHRETTPDRMNELPWERPRDYRPPEYANFTPTDPDGDFTPKRRS